MYKESWGNIEQNNRPLSLTEQLSKININAVATNLEDKLQKDWFEF